MNGKAPRSAAALIAGALWATSVCFSASPPKLSGSIVGYVTDATGVPQMGASVTLFNRNDRPLGKALTTEKGTFGFLALTPDIYSIRVELATYLPALKRNISVQPGMQSLLNVNLASVFSSIELIYSGPNQIMSDEWKWVLRSSSATRPILRFRPDLELAQVTGRRSEPASMFTGTRGMVRLSAGDQGFGSFLGSEPDLGTAFALATSVFGANHLHFAGNLGYSSYSGIPTAAFRTSFRHEADGISSPELKLTMRQLYLPGRVGSALLAAQLDGTPALRTLSASMLDQTQLTDDLRLQYGFSLDSVTFLDRLNYFSPFAKLTYDAGENGLVQFSYASGAPPAELYAGPSGDDLQLQQDLAALAMFPRISLRSGMARVQRMESYEVGYSKSFGSRSFSVGAYNEDVRNAALTMVGDMSAGAEFLPDLFSNGWIFNAGGFRSSGMTAALTQNLWEGFDATVAYGTGGALTAGQEVIDDGSPDALRELLRVSRRHSVTARVSGKAPGSGTEFVTSYQWSNIRALTPAHMYITQRIREGLGLNLTVRQPLPGFGIFPGRIEATAELRNLLAQGYVPLMANGRRLYLMHTPRSLRGGLSFIF